MGQHPDDIGTFLASLYGGLGLAEPGVVWCDDPVAFARQLGEVRYAEVVGRPYEPAPEDKEECGCPECLGVDVTARISGLASFDETEWVRVFIEAVGLHDPDASGPLMVRAHPVASVRPSRRFAWGLRTEPQGASGLPAVADAWAFTPSTAVLLRRGVWRTDDQGRLHDSVEGPGLDWGHWQTPFHHGVMLPLWALDPWEVTVERIIEETNVEARRSLAERYGLDRFVEDNPAATLLDDDPARGQLWNLGLRRYGEGALAVRVVDATPTPTGDRKVYWLRVPPTMQTAHEAVAWTFGMEPHEYQPEVET
jgi:hypothetical protein